MARKKTSVEYSDFTRGIITEASPLTFPDNASLDELNININRDGSRQRRFGMAWAATATTYSVTPLSTSGEAVSSYTWKSAGNDGDTVIGVAQIGRVLKFYDLDSDTPDEVVATYTFNSTQIPSPKHQARFQFASAYGKLIVVANTTSVFVFKWTGSSAALESTFSLNIRDRFGVADGLDVDEQPTTASISDDHRYNLYNQGWPTSTELGNLNYSGTSIGNVIGDPTTGNPVDFTYSSLGFWPSNADLFWAAKVTQLGSGTAAVDNIGTYNPLELQKNLFGTTQAGRGKYVIDLFNRGGSRASVSGLGGLGADITTGGISAVSSFAGRLWYGITEVSVTGGDTNTPNIGSMIFYSELSEDIRRWRNCHSRNDPTTEDYSDPLATDGGYISIPTLGQIYKMFPIGESMFILSSNGVWEVFGGDAGFSAQDQTVVQVTDVGPLSYDSIVAGENIIAYFAESGIYAITLDKTSLHGVAQNLTAETIQTLYDAIPLSERKKAVGNYDYLNKQVTWLYNEEAKESNFYYDRELVLHSTKAGFTKRKFTPVAHATNSGPYLCGYLSLRTTIPVSSLVPVTAGGVAVTASGIPVTIGTSAATQRTKSSTMYITAHNQLGADKIRIAGQTDFTFTDWPAVEDIDGGFGTDAEAYLITGAITGNDTKINKALPYVHVRAKRTESDWYETGEGLTMVGESSILMSAQWDWTNDPLSGRWSRASQVYRLPRLIILNPEHIFAFDVITTKNKVRGKGKAVSLKFASEPGKDLFLYGWGLEVAVES